jgi:hypothetical protein
VRICLVTPYACDRPNEANDHWLSLAGGLARLGHDVVVLAPARSAAVLREGRTRLRALERGEHSALAPVRGTPLVVAVGLAMPVRAGGPARRVALPVALRAGLRLALANGRFDVVDCLDPHLLGPSSLALRESTAPTVATWFRAARRGGRAADARIAVTASVADALAERLGDRPTVSGVAVDLERFAPGVPAVPPLVVVESAFAERDALKGLVAALGGTTAEVVLLQHAAPSPPRAVAPRDPEGRVHVTRVATPVARAAALRGASVFVAAGAGSPLLAREAQASGVPVVAPVGSAGAEGVEDDVSGLLAPRDVPAVVGAIVARLVDDEPLRARLGAGAREAAADSAPTAVARRVGAVYAAVVPKRRRAVPSVADAASNGSAQRILCDFHMHTEHSHDCATPVAHLVQRALELGLGAIAVTDHNTIAGGLAAQAYVDEHDLPLHVVVGSEVKTASGEVIGLYLQEEVQRGMPFADTVEAIHAQGALVYVPHPFDRMHAIPDPALLRRLVDQIDVFETYNARLYRAAFNRDAERFAERHDLLAGAGSDAHVLEGLGSGVVELPPFHDAESLLLALGQGQIVRRPANLLYLQGLKWLRQARSRSR